MRRSKPHLYRAQLQLLVNTHSIPRHNFTRARGKVRVCYSKWSRAAPVNHSSNKSINAGISVLAKAGHSCFQSPSAYTCKGTKYHTDRLPTPRGSAAPSLVMCSKAVLIQKPWGMGRILLLLLVINNIQHCCVFQVVFFQALTERNSTKFKKNPKQIKPAVCLPIIFLQSFNSQEQTTAFYYVTLNRCQPGPTSLPDINGPNLIPITQAAASQRGNTSEERSEFSFYIKRKHTCIHTYVWRSTIAVLHLTSQDCRAWASTCNTPEIRLLTVTVQTHIF